MRISDWSSDVCSSDLAVDLICQPTLGAQRFLLRGILYCRVGPQQSARCRSAIAFGRFDHCTCQLPRRRPPPEPSRKAIIDRTDGPGLVVEIEPLHAHEFRAMEDTKHYARNRTARRHAQDRKSTRLNSSQ